MVRRSAGPSATPASASTIADGPRREDAGSRGISSVLSESAHEDEERLPAEVDARKPFEPNCAGAAKPESIRAASLVPPARPEA